jgi:hypothetical protein
MADNLRKVWSSDAVDWFLTVIRIKSEWLPVHVPQHSQVLLRTVIAIFDPIQYPWPSTSGKFLD